MAAVTYDEGSGNPDPSVLRNDNVNLQGGEAMTPTVSVDGAGRLDSRIGGKMASSGERRVEADHAHGCAQYQPEDSRLTVC